MDTNKLIMGGAAVASGLLALTYYLYKYNQNTPTGQERGFGVGAGTTSSRVTTTTTTTTRTTGPPEMNISKPYNVTQDFSIKSSPNGLQGVPESIKAAIVAKGYSEQDVLRNPHLVSELLYSFEYEKIKREQRTNQSGAGGGGGATPTEISTPTGFQHNVHIYIDEKTKKIQGIPAVIREAIDKAGYTDEQIIQSPDLIRQLAYSFNFDDVFGSDDMVISAPTSFSHDFSITYNPVTGEYSGVPPVILEAISQAGYTLQEVLQNPMLVKDLLYKFDYSDLKSNEPLKISRPLNFSHDFSIRLDDKGNVVGLPEEIHAAILRAGYTIEQVMKDPMLIKDLLYSFDYNSLKLSSIKISRPIKSTHDFSVNINPETGEVSGVPQEILDAIKNAGYTIKDVIQNPLLVRDLLYNFDYDSLKPDAAKISAPIQSSHDFSISYDPQTGQVNGIPEEILTAIKNSGYTMEQVVANPSLVKDLLYKFDYQSLKEHGSVGAPRVSSPIQSSHDFRISIDQKTGEVSGVPQPILDAIQKAGYTTQQVLENPELVKDILYSIDYENVKSSTISRPVQVSHDFSIKFDPETGGVSGIPPPIQEAITKAGLTIEQVIKDPSLVKDLLYEQDYATVKEQSKPQISLPTNVKHDFSIKFDPATGKVEGVPPEIKQALLDKGYTDKDITNPSKELLDLLYSFNYSDVTHEQEKQ